MQDKGACFADAKHQALRIFSPNGEGGYPVNQDLDGWLYQVRLVHDCWLYEAEGIDALKLLNEDDRQYLWLPLAHSFGKVLEAAQLRSGFSTAVDGRVEKIVENLGQVKPTFVAAVPRIFEKIYNKIVTGAKEAGGAKRAIFSWARVSIAPAKSTPSTRPAPRPARAAAMATSPVPVHTSSRVSRPVKPSERIARRRQ